MVDIGTALRHYKKEDIQKEMVLHAENKEVVGSFKGEGYAKRPDTLTYPRDILELVKQGITSFHASEELWSNPLQIDPMMKKQDVEKLRIGWDLVIDIDCPYWDYSKLIADLIVKALKHYNIDSLSVKFSGNKGFHIGVPFEAFPKKIGDEDVSKKFPDHIRLIANYLKNMIKNVFLKKVLEIEKNNIKKIAENLQKPLKEISTGKKLDPEKMIDIDTILISSRHLYRMPYSLHEKSGLCSIPVDPDKIMGFDKSSAKPENIFVNKKFRFLERENIQQNQAKELFDKATEMMVIKKSMEDFKNREIRPKQEIPEDAIPEKFFPPCIKNILTGLSDGKKRSLFILTNFLTCCGWEHDKIKTLLKKWNKQNDEPLREVLLVSQLRYHKNKKKNIPPPNCQNSMYYKDFGICKPDNLCRKIKNPVQYSKRKTYFLNKNKSRKKS